MSLEAEFGSLLRELSIIAGDVPAQNFEARVKGGEGQHLLWETPLDINYWIFRWHEDESKAARERVLASLAAYLQTLRKGQANDAGQLPELSSAQQRWWLLWSGTFNGVDYRIAAKRLGLHPARVKAIRKSVGLSGASGLRQKATPKRKVKVPTATVSPETEGE